MEFWERAFREKQMMWGEVPTVAAVETARRFETLGYRKILVPGFGYGRNAKAFLELGLEVVGIEISETAVNLGRRLHGPGVRIIQGSVADMPFDSDTFDGIFSHALIHLLDAEARSRFLSACFGQLNPQGTMVFTTLSKDSGQYGSGLLVGKERYRTPHGVELFFYDEESIEEEFGRIGLTERVLYREDQATGFWKIVCRKD